MPRGSPTQTNFQGGEWSPQALARIDLPSWAAALALSRNAIIGEDGTWQRRSGTQRWWNLRYCKDQVYRLTRTDGLPLLVCAGSLVAGGQGGIMVFAPGGMTTEGNWLQGIGPLLNRLSWQPYCSEYIRVSSITDDGNGFAVLNLATAPANGNLLGTDEIVIYHDNGTVSADTYPQLVNYMFRCETNATFNTKQTYIVDPSTAERVTMAALTLTGNGAADLWVGHVWRGFGPLYRQYTIAQPPPLQETFQDYTKQMRVVQADNDIAYFFTAYTPPWILTFAPGSPLAFQNAGFVGDGGSVGIGTDGPYLDPPTGSGPAGTGQINVVSGSDGNYTLQITDGSGAFRTSANPALNNVSGLDVGRALRCWSQPAEWNSGTNYSEGNFVTYPRGLQGSSWVCQIANSGQIPGSLITESNGVVLPAWFPAPQAAGWVAGHITSVISHTECTATLFPIPGGDGSTADELIAQNGSTFQTWQLGVFSGPDPALQNSGGPEVPARFPTTGLYHEGRMWMAGAYANRIDGSMVAGDTLNTYTPDWAGSRGPLAVPIPQFSPTDGFGNVLDDSGISVLLENDTNEIVNWLAVDHMGILAGTLEAEWLLFASALNDPITPTSIQAHKVSKYGSNVFPPVYPGIAHVFIQRYGTLIEELMVDVFSQRFSARPLNELALHLSVAQAIQLAYHETPVPTIWALMADGTLASCNYRRKSYFVSEEPMYKAWCSHRLGMQLQPPNAWTPSMQQVNAITTAPCPEFNVRSVFVPQAGFGGQVVDSLAEPTLYFAPTFPTIQPPTKAETLVLITQGYNAAHPSNNTIGYLETMRPFFGPLDSLNQAWFVDAGISGGSLQYTDGQRPAAPALIGLIGSSGVTFYGLRMLASQTVSAHIMGMDLGLVTIGKDGSVLIPWQGQFTLANIEQYQLGKSPGVVSDYYGAMGTPVGNPSVPPAYDIPAVFGWAFTSAGQRPAEQRGDALRLPSGNAFAKYRKQAMVGMYVSSALGVNYQVDNGPVQSAKSFLTPSGQVPTAANTNPGPGYAPIMLPVLYTGVLWETVDGDSNFLQQFGWSVQGLLPFILGAVTQFIDTEER